MDSEVGNIKSLSYREKRRYFNSCVLYMTVFNVYKHAGLFSSVICTKIIQIKINAVYFFSCTFVPYNNQNRAQESANIAGTMFFSLVYNDMTTI